MRMVSCPFRLSVFHKSNYNAIIVRQLTDAKRNMGPKSTTHPPVKVIAVIFHFLQAYTQTVWTYFTMLMISGMGQGVQCS